MFPKCFPRAGTGPGTFAGFVASHPNHPVRQRMVSYHLAGVASRERGSQDLAQSVRGRAEVALSVCGSHHRWPGFLPRGCRPLPVRSLGPKC